MVSLCGLEGFGFRVLLRGSVRTLYAGELHLQPV